MELDELKSHLNYKLASDHAGRSDADIAQLLHKRTNSVVSKIKRSLLFEIRLCIPFIFLFILVGIFNKENTFRIYFSVFAVFFAGILFVLLYLLKRTSRLSESPLPVKDNLQTIVNIIDEFVKRCFQIALIMIPVCIAFIAGMQYYFKESLTFSSRYTKGFFTAPWQMIAFLIVYAGVFTLVMYYFAKWYLNKLYGRYVRQLRECIAELEE